MTGVERQLWRALGTIDGFLEGSSIFSEDDKEPAYFVNGTQVANLTAGGVGLRLTRGVISAHRAKLKADPRVDLRRSGSDWIVVTVSSRADVDFIRGLAELAADAHRPPSGVTAKLPPTGPELARRRRFH